MPSVRDLLRARSNDYSALEATYLEATGTSLVLDPYASYGRALELNRSASIIIATHNSRASLESSLVSIESTTFNQRYPDLLDVIVVDDGSTDETRDMVCSLDLDLNIRYLRQERSGIAAAHNTGVAFSESEVIIFADSDIIHLPFGVEELMKRHQVLDGVTLVGFRFAVEANDSRLASSRLRPSLATCLPDFQSDFRLSYPGRPANMCRDTDHLKQLGFGRTLRTGNGAEYNLAAMVVGALFSMEREDFIAIGGADERLRGWGCEDTLIGAKSIALGNYVIPVYAAACGHVTHPPRDPTQAVDFQRNIRSAEAAIEEDFSQRSGLDARRCRVRVLEQFEGPGRRTGREPVPPPDAYPLPKGASRQWGDYFYALGQFEEALGRYEDAARVEPDRYWAMLGIAKTKRELGSPDACAAFDECIALDPRNALGCFEGGLAYAAAGDYHGALQLMRRGAGHFDVDWALSQGTDVHKQRGNHHATQEFHRVAITDFALAAIVDPRNSWAVFDRGVSLQSLGRTSEALRCVEAADRLLHPHDGNRTWMHARLGALYSELGQFNEAKLQLQLALQLCPENEQAASADVWLTTQAEAAAQLNVNPLAFGAISSIPGWLSPDEAELLAAAARLSLVRRPPTASLVELGSYCGRSTAVIATALRDARSPRALLTTIDPHEERMPADGLTTLHHLHANLNRLDLESYVKIVVGRSQTVPWNRPIAFLYIDALHDYESVAADFRRFSPLVAKAGLVAFHDYSDYFPGVKRLVNEVLGGSEYGYVSQRGHLIVLQRGVTTSPS